MQLICQDAFAPEMTSSKISSLPDPNRVLERLERLWEIGEPPFANRPGLSQHEQTAALQVQEWMTAAGMTVGFDPIGNVVGVRPGREPQLPEVWLGSHIDTVPAGGRFDGALGVAVAVEALSRLTTDMDRTVRVLAFRDEEGWRFGRSCLGSRALCGKLQPGELQGKDASGVTVESALARLGFSASPVPLAGWLQHPPRCFVEVHIEQGPVLSRAGCPIGSVTAIVGVAEWQLTFTGRSGHAGTTPMSDRSDALVAASSFITRLPLIIRDLPGAVATVGSAEVRPGAQNVIPERVQLSVDLRAPTPATLDRLVAVARDLAQQAMRNHRCSVEILERSRSEPADMSEQVRTALEDGISDLGFPVLRLPSGAGHDAAILAAASVPVGMLFVRSLNDGVSHSPEELTDPEAISVATAVLMQAVAHLARA
jgi:allantoate deiminase